MRAARGTGRLRPAITGVTALADGTDQLFARAVLDQGGQIEVIVPTTRYRDGLPAESHREYDELLGTDPAIVTTGHRHDQSAIPATKKRGVNSPMEHQWGADQLSLRVSVTSQDRYSALPPVIGVAMISGTS